MKEQMNQASCHEQPGNYRIIRLLGQGGFASAYPGKHIYLNTKFCTGDRLTMKSGDFILRLGIWPI